MDNYSFKSEYLKLTLYDSSMERLNISKTFGSRWAKNVKEELDGLDILDEDAICKAIGLACAESFWSTDCFDGNVNMKIQVVYDDKHMAGLRYHIYNSDKCNELNLVIHITDPNLDLSELLS